MNILNDEGMMVPYLGADVIYRSRTGNYDIPGKVAAVKSSLHRPNVEAGHIADLDSEMHVHLVCFTPGTPGQRSAAADFLAEEGVIAENVAGVYQEWNVAYDPDANPGTWRWEP